jgi:hypothetical protein
MWQFINIICIMAEEEPKDKLLPIEVNPIFRSEKVEGVGVVNVMDYLRRSLETAKKTLVKKTPAEENVAPAVDPILKEALSNFEAELGNAIVELISKEIVPIYKDYTVNDNNFNTSSQYARYVE